MNPKLFRNKDLRSALINSFLELCKLEKIDDRLALISPGKNEYDPIANIYTAFLLICEVGENQDKINAYNSLITLLNKVTVVAGYAQTEECVRRFFTDTNDQSPLIRYNALNILKTLLEHQEIGVYFVQRKLISNLITKILAKYPESADDINEILKATNNYASHSPDLWKSPELSEERKRIKSLKIGDLNPSVKGELEILLKHIKS